MSLRIDGVNSTDFCRTGGHIILCATTPIGLLELLAKRHLCHARLVHHVLCLSPTHRFHLSLSFSFKHTPQDLVLSEVETLAVLGAGGFGKVTLVRYKGKPYVQFRCS